MIPKRYIRAYHKQTETLAFEIKLPENALDMLFHLTFLKNDSDPLLYTVYELNKEQVDLIYFHYFKRSVADTDYFDYFLECDSEAVRKIKTQEELLDHLKGEEVFDCFIDLLYFQHRSLLNIFKDMCYKIYQQGVEDGRL